MSDPNRIADKRVARSQAAVLAETYRQLSQSGISGVSIDEVARVSGVSKTTIYRHWPSRSALLIDACSRLGGGAEAPDTGNALADLTLLLEGLSDQLQNAGWSGVYPSIIDAAERDPEIRTLQLALHQGFMAPFEAVIERARARGELPSNRKTSELVAVLIGPLFFCRWFSKENFDADFVRAIAEFVMR